MIGSSKNSNKLAVLVVSAFAVYTTEAQIGTVICACQPGIYNITLDFGLECNDKDINEFLPGINSSACQVTSDAFPPPLTIDDPFPVSVSNILISELDFDLQTIIKQENFTGTFVNGDQLNYTSFIEEDPAAVNLTTLPHGLIVILTGVNAAGVELQNTYVIEYTNNCSTYPVLDDDNQIGWTIVVSRN
jgi:hypothetical protein